jgi:hypothetical protein
LDVVNDVHHKVQNRNIKFFVFGLHKKGKDWQILEFWKCALFTILKSTFLSHVA